MDLRQLQMLKAVVEAGSYAKAGERLWVTHSAIHRQIRLLEEEVKDRILVKVGRKMELTETGKILVSLAQKVSSDIEETERQIASRSKKLSGTFRIGTSTTTLSFFLPPILSAFRVAHPAVALHILTGTAERVMDAVRMHDLDIGIIMGGKQLSSSSLLRHPLYEEEFVIGVHKDHPLVIDNTDRTVSLRDLAGATFIMHVRASHLRRMEDQLFEAAKIAPKVGMELENEETMELMVAIGMGIAFLSKHRKKEHPDIVYLDITDVRISSDVAVIYSNDEYHSPIFREFLKLCHEQVAATEATSGSSKSFTTVQKAATAVGAGVHALSTQQNR